MGMVLRQLKQAFFKTFNEPFTYADSDPANVSEWLDYGSDHTSSVKYSPGRIWNNMWFASTAATTAVAAYNGVNVSNKVLTSDNMEVMATTVNPPSGTVGPNYNTQLGVRARTGSRNFVGAVHFRSTANTHSIMSFINNTGVARANGASTTTAVNTRIKLRAVGNTYTYFRDGVRFIQWVDSGNIYPVGPDYRRIAVQGTVNRTSSTAVQTGPGWDNLTASVYPYDKPNAQSATLNANLQLATNTWTILGSWRATDISAQPYTTIDNTAATDRDLEIDGPGNVIVAGQMQLNATVVSTTTSGLRITKNGVVVLQTSLVANQQTANISTAMSVLPGDLIRLEGNITSGTTTQRVAKGATTGTTGLTNLTITPL